MARNERPWDSLESLYRKGGTFLERRRRTIAESRRVYVEIERRQIMGRDIQWGLYCMNGSQVRSYKEGTGSGMEPEALALTLPIRRLVEFLLRNRQH